MYGWQNYIKFSDNNPCDIVSKYSMWHVEMTPVNVVFDRKSFVTPFHQITIQHFRVVLLIAISSERG